MLKTPHTETEFYDFFSMKDFQHTGSEKICLLDTYKYCQSDLKFVSQSL